MRNLVALIFLCASTFVCAQVDEEVEITTETGTLKGALMVPEGEGTFPVVMIIAGSGPTDRNGNNAAMTNNSLQLLAEGLYDNDIASLRFDKRGVAASVSAMTGEEDLRFETYIEDAESWGEYLKGDPRFDELVVMGHSEGSLIGMIAAKRMEADKFISIAGVGRPAADILREQLSVQPPGVTAMTDPIIESLERGETVDSVNPMLNVLFRPSVQPYLISWFKYDPAQAIAALNVPVLILQGTTDIQVKIKDAEMLASANPDAEKVIFDGMNHVLKEAPIDRMENMKTYNDPSLPLMVGLVEAIIDFIGEN
ncbi:alpha/beta hydrolase [Muriicola soli]|uniref:Alpha/beta hydrolase n=1 Tax=Muriicola soli TaxID=2507538 RepID=A0A411ECU6_9FLAO|nr:alpha/beta hydrolase [Muriicola soli]